MRVRISSARRSGCVVAVTALSVLATTMALASPAAEAKGAPPATVSKVKPSSGFTTGGIKVTIKGTGFNGVTGVYFGKTKATAVKVASTKKLTALAPAHSAGTVAVTVRTSATGKPKAGQFSYAVPPVTSATSPGAMSHSVTLTWKPAGGPGYAGVVVREAIGSTPPAGPTSGTAVATVPASASSYTVTGLTPGTTYAFSIFATDTKGHTSTGGSVVAKTMTWGDRQLADPTQGDPTSISCPTTDMCVAVDGSGKAFTETSGTWSGPASVIDDGPLASVSCASPTSCVAVGGHAAAVYDSGTWSTTTDVDPAADLTAVSCASASVCVAVDDDGNSLTYTSGQADDWTSAQIDSGDPMSTVSCVVGSTLCVAGDIMNGTYVLSGGTWSSAGNAVGIGQLTDISCPTTSYCLAGGGDGAVSQWNGAAWTQPASDPFENGAGPETSTYVSCASSSFCGVVDSAGRVDTWNGSAWDSGFGADGFAPEASGISCVVDHCTAITADGNFTALPAGSYWSNPAPFDASTQVLGLSCASAEFCSYMDGLGRTGSFDGSSWSGPSPSGLGTAAVSVSCPTPTYCVAVGGEDVDQWKGGVWSLSQLNAFSTLTSVSCASASFCGVTDLRGDFTEVTPHGHGQPGLVDGNGLSDLSCSSATLCAAVDGAGRLLTFDGNSWSSPSYVDADGTAVPLSVSCSGASFCAAVDNAGRATFFNGTSWSAPVSLGTTLPLIGVSCVPSRYCYGVTQRDDQVVGFGPGLPPAIDPVDDTDPLVAVSCVTAPDCMILDDAGNTVHGS